MTWEKILKEKVPTFEETGAFDGPWEEDEKETITIDNVKDYSPKDISSLYYSIKLIMHNAMGKGDKALDMNSAVELIIGQVESYQKGK